MKPPVTSTLEALRSAQRRRTNITATISVATTLALLAVVFARTAQLQLLTPSRLNEHTSPRAARLVLDAPRGDIRDRNGRILAASTPAFRLVLDPHALLTQPAPATQEQTQRRLHELITQLNTALPATTDPHERALAIATATQRAADRINDNRTPLRYARLTHALPDHAVPPLKTLAAAHPALHLEPIPRRINLAPHGSEPIVGLVGFSHDGILGVEAAFDESLKPKHGHIDYTRDANGRPLWINADDYTMPKRGDDLALSIDAHLQHATQQELARAVAHANAAGGRAVLIDPATGELLAIADHTNPRLTTAPASTAEHEHELTPFDTELADRARREDLRLRFQTITPDPNADPDNPRAIPALAPNRCVEHVYEPGSTFKPFIWAAALAHDVARPEETIDTERGRWRTPDGRTIEDVYPYDEQTFRDVLINSSNIGMIKAAHGLAPRDVRAAITRFGFNTPTNVGLPGEATGILTPLQRWRPSTHTSVAMGYEIAVTPLQMARAFAVFARTGPVAGTLPTLTLRATPTAPRTDASQDTDTNTIVRRVLPPHIAAETRDTLAAVAERMLRNRSRVFPDESPFPWTMFGKSGTSKIARPDGQGYFDWQYHSSFIAAAPVDNPRLVVVAIIDDPDPELARRRLAFGSQVAGPLAARVLHRGLDYLGVPRPADD